MTEKVKTIGTATEGIYGYLREVEVKPDTMLVFQLARRTDQMSRTYVEGATRAVKSFLPEGKKALFIGSDVNIYELPGMDAAFLILKGIE